MADEKEIPETKQIFINNVDDFFGKNVGKYLSTCVVGASLEEEEEEEDAKSTSSTIMQQQKEGCYQIIGTLKDSQNEKPSFVKEIIQYETRDQLYEHLVECDIIIYNISTDSDSIKEAVWAVSELHSDLEKIEKPKTFVLVSSVMTWGENKPALEDDQDPAFSEENYTTRKAHVHFKEHQSAEKTVLKLGKTNKSKLLTYVVASGLAYGKGENIFHWFFKSAWQNEPSLKIFGQGSNILPTIHIQDLATVIQYLVDQRPKGRYILGVDDSYNTLMEIVNSVSEALGSGKTEHVEATDGKIYDIPDNVYDHLLVNLRMESIFVKDNFPNMKWVCETGLKENLELVVDEYKQARNLQPIRAIVLGPPGVGKTLVVNQLCKHYKLHHIKVNEIITKEIEDLEKLAARADVTDEDEEGAEKAEKAEELLKFIKENKERNDGRLDSQGVAELLSKHLMSRPCQNQGFILDGCPETRAQAQELFTNEEGEEENGRDVPYNKNVMAQYVFHLSAPEEQIRESIMALPEAEVAGTDNTEENWRQRMDEYVRNNTEENTVLNYFDEIEIYPEKLDVSQDKSPMLSDTVASIKKYIGKPHNYGPTERELFEMRLKEEEERLAREEEEREERSRLEKEEAEEKFKKQKEWTERLREVQKEEHELLQTQSVPLRNYLMKHVMPTLTKALIDVTKVRPEDPVDYLAEYLFKNNPQVD